MRRRIREGQWTAGMLLPGRLDLSREYDVSLFTLQRAIGELLEDGTLRADSRKGTYVSDTPPATQPAVVETRELGTFAIMASMLGGHSGLAAVGQAWIASVVRSAEDTFRRAGGSVIVLNRLRDEQPRMPIGEAIASARAQGATSFGLLELNPIGHEIGAVLDALDPDETPFVCTSGDEIMAPVAHIGYDSRQAGYEAASHLIKQGCRSLTFFAPFAATWSDERLAGARQAVRHAGLADDCLNVYPTEAKTLRNGYLPEACDHAHQAIELGVIGQGVIAQNDHVGVGFLQAARERGLSAGRDYALVGFDDITEAIINGMSTMRPPIEAMGEAAAQSVIDALQGRPTRGHIRMRSQLIVRASSGTRP
jgi:DNA-binding LacI/PurR family transcriptional regulator